MKFLLSISLFIFLCDQSYSQLIADPSLQQVSFTYMDGSAAPDTLPEGLIVQLNIPLRNQDASTGIPAGSCKVKIGLGSKMALDPATILSLVPSSEYFTWSADFVGGQVQLTGDLRVALPPNYSGVAKFNVYGSIPGYSTITSNFLVTNHNSPVILSDENPDNNTSFRQYKIIPVNPTPVNFSNVSAVNNNCTLRISFHTENEINVAQYAAEISTDGNKFTAVKTLQAAGLRQYYLDILLSDLQQADHLFIRIKAVDKDGAYKYSSTKMVSGKCYQSGNIVIYPNPITSEQYITVNLNNIALTANTIVSLYDITGKLVHSKQYILNNQTSIQYPVKGIAAGEYILKINNQENATAVKLIKLQ